LRLEAISRETMEKLSELGVRRIFFGWESGNNRVLKLINKAFTKEYILEKCRVLADFPEISLDASAIIGFPTETWEEIQETVDMAVEMSKILPNVDFNLGTYMPYPGTSLYELAIAEGFKPPQRIEDWKDFNTIDLKAELTWIRWAGSSTRRKLFLIDKYAHYLSKPAEFKKGKNIFKYLGKLILCYLARFRMKNRLFIFPVEVYFYVLWTQWSMSKNIRNFR
jgi:radical SAM superfamily enzyme YgiQ (UPF0313 family)